MKDRVPRHPGRVTLTPVPGQANTYDMVRADEPIEEGTALNKNTLLGDSTASKLGLNADKRVPSLAFEALLPTVKVTTIANSTVEASTPGVTPVTAVADSSGVAVLRIGLATWTIRDTTTQVSKVLAIDSVRLYELSLIASLSKLSWSQISGISSAGVAAQMFSIGDTKPVTVGAYAYDACIVDFAHNDLESGGKAGITFLLDHAIASQYKINQQNTSVGGWDSCDFRNTTVPELLGTMDQDVQAVIKRVKNKTSSGKGSTTLLTSIDTLFLPSVEEVIGASNPNVTVTPGEGTQFEYFKAGNSTGRYRFPKVSGDNGIWWSRSPKNASGSDLFRLIYPKSDSYPTDPYRLENVAFAFCV